jgi:hypothetical protein
MTVTVSRYSRPQPFPRTAVRRRQLDVSPAADRRGCCSPRRRLPGGASSRHPAVRHRRPGRHGQDASHGIGRRAVSGIGCPPIWCRRPGSGGPAVRYPARPVSGHLGSSSGCPAVRSPAVHPSGVRPCGVHPASVQPAGVRPSVRMCLSPPIPGGGVGPRSVRRAPVNTGTGRVPVGCRAVERFGGRPSRPGRGRCCRLGCWSAGVGGARAPVGYGGGACPLSDHPRPACGAPVAGGGARHRMRLRREVADLLRGCRRGWAATTVGGGRGSLPPGWAGPEGPRGLLAGMGVRPQRGPGWQPALPARGRQRSDLRG